MTNQRPPDGTEWSRGQMRFAKRFRKEYEGQYLYCHGIGWHRWDGCRWLECLDESAGRAVESLLDAARWEIPAMTDRQKAKDLFTDVTRLENNAGITGVLAIARRGEPLGIPGKDMNPDPTLLNCLNGTLNLDTGEMREADPADHITKVTGAEFHDDAVSGVWDEFVARILPDEDVRAFVQRLFGLALLGKVREHILPIFTGLGANGKGTMRDVVLHSLGDYAIEVSPDILLESRSDRHSTELMDLQGARVVFANETDQGRKFAEATMKRLVGGDPIRARRMNQNTVQFDPSHTIIMMTNKLPEVSGDDPAVWRRIYVVPFDVVIPVDERDGTLPDKLKAESAAVLAWIHVGWVDYLCQGLNPPEAVMARTLEYQSVSDVYGRFIADECVLVHVASVQSRALYHRFEKWCQETGERPVSEKVFSPAIAKRDGISKGKTHGISTFMGIGLAAREDENKDRYESSAHANDK